MKQRIIFLFALCAFSLSLSALPARRGAMTLTQPDGTQITAFLHGDAFFHYYSDAEGNMLQKDENGFYQATTMPSDEELHARWAKAPRRVTKQQQTATPINLAPRGLIILVNFADLAFKTDVEEMDSMINGQNYKRRYFNSNQLVLSSGSARQYFHDNSCGKYNPVFDVVGPVTLSRGYKYYGGNDSYWNQDKRADVMITEACDLVDDQVDFTRYDNNKDGYLDFVYVIYAGYSEADGAGDDYIWPHNSTLTQVTTFKVDGLIVDNYACSSELDYYSKEHDGIGTFCHEFSHVLGLPDLYITEDKNTIHKTMGEWDILDYGPYNNDGNTPPCYSAYERFFMGWLTPTIVNSACNVQLGALSNNNHAVLLSATGTHNLLGNDPSPTVFYLLENRQKNGWDAYLPGNGMLVTKINYDSNKWATNTVNNNPNTMGVDLIESDGLAPDFNQYKDNGNLGKFGDAYPYGDDKFTELDDYQVTDITLENGEIFFKVNGGGETIVLSAVDEVLQPAVAIRKVMRDGQIIIEHNGNYYDLLGKPIR